MAVTETSICNSALAKLGAERIISLDADNNRARLMKEQYEKIRDDLLYAHPWNFAIARVSIAALTDAPLSDFAYQLQLPNDCLRVVDTDLPRDVSWNVEGRLLLCDYSPVIIKYIKKETDTSKYTPGFIEVLACKIAADCAYSITQSTTLTEQMNKKYEFQLRQARSFDAQESVGDRVYADSWLNSRA